MAKTATQCPATGGTNDGGDDGSKAATTFVQADSTCFRDLVQRLTGPSGSQAPAPVVKSPAPKPSQKLHERRKYNKPKIEISKPDGFQAQPPLQPNIPISPSMLFAGSPVGGFGAYLTSPSSSVMMWSPQSSPISAPMAIGSSNKRISPSSDSDVLELQLNPGEEEKAIKEKRFYLHPSPRSKPRLAPAPELLTLFPLESPTTSSDTVKGPTLTL